MDAAKLGDLKSNYGSDVASQQTEGGVVSSDGFPDEPEKGIVSLLTQPLHELAVRKTETPFNVNFNITYAPQTQHNQNNQYEANTYNYDMKGAVGCKVANTTADEPEPESQETANSNVPAQPDVEPTAGAQARQPNLMKELKTDAEVIEDFKRTMKNRREQNVVHPGLKISQKDIPVVHPQICNVSLYEGMAVPDDDRYEPNVNKLQNINVDKTVSFNDLLLECRNIRYVGIAGIPGAGKTTLSKRLVEDFDKESDSLTLRLKFMNLNNFEIQKLTLQQLLLDNPEWNLNERSKGIIFRWILDNQKKCILVLDGLDQAKWKITKKNAVVSQYSTPLIVEDLFGNLCCGNFLPGVHLVVTSRPHSLLNIPNQFRPEAMYLLKDLNFNDMKELFFALAGEESDRLWNAMNTTAPQLVGLCLNPLMLLLYIRAALKPSQSIGEITTKTRIFAAVMNNLQQSEHMRESVTKSFKDGLSRMAYRATKHGTILIDAKELLKENLDIHSVQDVIIVLQASENNFCHMFEGKEKLYFSHQTLQEYFSALYISTQMDIKDFLKFLNKYLFKEHWSVVAQFVCGIILEPQASSESLGHAKSFPLVHSSSSEPESESDISENSFSEASIKSISSSGTTFEIPLSDVATKSTRKLTKWKRLKRLCICGKLNSEDEEKPEIPPRIRNGNDSSTSLKQPLVEEDEETEEDKPEIPPRIRIEENVSFTSLTQPFTEKGRDDEKPETPPRIRWGENVSSTNLIQPLTEEEEETGNTVLENATPESSLADRLEIAKRRRGRKPKVPRRNTPKINNTVTEKQFQKDPIGCKREMLLEMLEKRMMQISQELATFYSTERIPEKKEFMDLCEMCRESNNIAVTKKVSKGVPMQIYLNNYKLTTSQAHAFYVTFKHVTTFFKLSFNRCYLDSNSFHWISKAIQEMSPRSLESLDIDENYLTDIGDILQLLRSIDKYLTMCECFADGQGGRRDANAEERGLIKKELIALNNKDLNVCVEKTLIEPEDGYVYWDYTWLSI